MPKLESAYDSQNDPRLHFGVEKAEKIDTVEIAWPSGLRENRKHLTANQLVAIGEGQGIVKSGKWGAR